jgi:hypothetical protein
MKIIGGKKLKFRSLLGIFFLLLYFVPVIIIGPVPSMVIIGMLIGYSIYPEISSALTFFIAMILLPIAIYAFGYLLGLALEKFFLFWKID